MAIRRVTYEIDDSPERGPTRLPEGVHPATELEPLENRLTDVARPEEFLSTSRGERARPPATGRTPSDLFVEFVHQPRAMATLLTFAPCVAYAPWVDMLTDLLVPLALGAILNSVWFGVGYFTRRKPADDR